MQRKTDHILPTPALLATYKQIPQTKDILQSAFNQDRKFIQYGCGKRLNKKPDDLSSYPKLCYQDHFGQNFIESNPTKSMINSKHSSIMNVSHKVKIAAFKPSFDVLDIEDALDGLVSRHRQLHLHARNRRNYPGTPQSQNGMRPFSPLQDFRQIRSQSRLDGLRISTKQYQ
ncbi:hypothetical protein SS50377_22920 [Spironucleus salmonicida]|uniref:Uncharacterized protein n=1 Tax=Spironucleus salmonicida TaxID=348837 RepID=V6LW24_9EUKA|nr:hypothetical protein SS50377_22920 [Spironucleus salmonicida]|eukprot:EST48765.1 Hypothetical protein SS50377_11090 [Spironucleus salmonicida]